MILKSIKPMSFTCMSCHRRQAEYEVSFSDSVSELNLCLCGYCTLQAKAGTLDISPWLAPEGVTKEERKALLDY